MAADRWIVLQSAVSTCDEHVAGNIRKHQAVQTKSMLRLDEDDVSAAQASFGHGLHVNYFSVANCGSHAGSAGLEANANSRLQAL
jgi:hypothetical protein